MSGRPCIRRKDAIKDPEKPINLLERNRRNRKFAVIAGT